MAEGWELFIYLFIFKSLVQKALLISSEKSLRLILFNFEPRKLGTAYTSDDSNRSLLPYNNTTICSARRYHHSKETGRIELEVS